MLAHHRAVYMLHWHPWQCCGKGRLEITLPTTEADAKHKLAKWLMHTKWQLPNSDPVACVPLGGGTDADQVLCFVQAASMKSPGSLLPFYLHLLQEDFLLPPCSAPLRGCVCLECNTLQVIILSPGQNLSL